MCDPLVGGLLAGAASLVTGSMAASQEQATQDAQEQGNAQWVAYQNKIRADSQAIEEQQRQKAESARQDTLQKISPANQQQEQTTEAARLTALYQDPSAASGTKYSNVSPDDPSSVMLSGQSGVKMPDLAGQVNNATTLARKRIAALATAGSYGGSSKGLGTLVPQQFALGGEGINEAANIRNSNLRTYGVEQQVAPPNFVVGPGTTAMAGIAKSLGGVAGSLIGSGFSGGSSGWS